jgi:hypothetical protein
MKTYKEKPNPQNTVVVSVAAWNDADFRTEIFRRSAEKQGIKVHFIDYGAEWQGFYQHKITNLRRELLKQKENGIRYALFADARDVVFVGSAEEIINRFALMDQGNILFAADKPQTVFPFQEPWFQKALAAHCSNGYGVLNAGTYAGNIVAILSLFDECDRLRETACQLNGMPTIPLERALIEGKKFYFDDDQFFVQILQAQGYPGIHVDTEKQLFAVFDHEYPPIRERISLPPEDERSLGTALILHSPWLSKKETEKGESLWKQWVIREKIIDPLLRK